MKGRIVPKTPSARAGEQDYDWDEYARTALAHPDSSVLAAEHVPISRINSLRMYSRPPFVDDNGVRKVAVKMRNSAKEDDGVRYGDVYLEAV